MHPRPEEEEGEQLGAVGVELSEAERRTLVDLGVDIEAFLEGINNNNNNNGESHSTSAPDSDGSLPVAKRRRRLAPPSAARSVDSTAAVWSALERNSELIISVARAQVARARRSYESELERTRKKAEAAAAAQRAAVARPLVGGPAAEAGPGPEAGNKVVKEEDGGEKVDEGALKEEEEGERAGQAELEDGERASLSLPLSASPGNAPPHEYHQTLIPHRSAPLNLSQSASRLSRLPPRRIAKTRPPQRRDNNNNNNNNKLDRDDAPARPPAPGVPLATRAALARRAAEGTEFPRDARPATCSRGQVARECFATGDGDGRLWGRWTGDGLEGLTRDEILCAARVPRCAH